MIYCPRTFTALLLNLFGTLATAAEPNQHTPLQPQPHFTPQDVFQLEHARDPRISPDGSQIVYVRNFMDVMTDRQRASLWTINFDGSEHRPLTDGDGNETQPRWSSDGKRVAYVSSPRNGAKGAEQLYVRWMDTGQTARLTQLTHAPASLAWSPDGKSIAFSMLVPEEAEPMVEMPKAPKDAEWAEPAKVVRKFFYRFDGDGYLEEGYKQVFVVSSDGGTPRQLTFGPYHHEGKLAWTPDSEFLIFSANRNDDWELDPRESELYELKLSDGALRQLTKRKGPDMDPTVSADGAHIAYIGFDDKLLGYHNAELYVMAREERPDSAAGPSRGAGPSPSPSPADRGGGSGRSLTAELDRLAHSPEFSHDNDGVFFQYEDEGDTKIAFAKLDGQLSTVATNVGGTTLGRPYSSGSFTVGAGGRVAFTQTSFDHPADVAVAEFATKVPLPGPLSRERGPGRGTDASNRLTRLNDDLFGHKELAEAEEFWVDSSADGQKIQCWLLKPPGFSSEKKYPLILEIHGGPFADYGARFAAELQLYAAAGYVVLYVNPRGSTGYGHDFANLIHHNYPGQDYDDLMSAVDEVVGRGYVDPEELFVTGGSGGGVLTAWIVGKTDRFRAAVAAKPVINWYSFALTADAYSYFYKYWFPGYPWEHAEEYMRRSPISLVGNVTTPTMLITGEEDHRTPISESEQYYQALKLRKVDTVLVRIPGASHSIASRPSRLISKAMHVLAWFDQHRKDTEESTDED